MQERRNVASAHGHHRRRKHLLRNRRNSFLELDGWKQVVLSQSSKNQIVKYNLIIKYVKLLRFLNNCGLKIDGFQANEANYVGEYYTIMTFSKRKWYLRQPFCWKTERFN